MSAPGVSGAGVGGPGAGGVVRPDGDSSEVKRAAAGAPAVAASPAPAAAASASVGGHSVSAWPKFTNPDVQHFSNQIFKQLSQRSGDLKTYKTSIQAQLFDIKENREADYNHWTQVAIKVILTILTLGLIHCSSYFTDKKVAHDALINELLTLGVAVGDERLDREISERLSKISQNTFVMNYVINPIVRNSPSEKRWATFLEDIICPEKFVQLTGSKGISIPAIVDVKYQEALIKREDAGGKSGKEAASKESNIFVDAVAVEEVIVFYEDPEGPRYFSFKLDDQGKPALSKVLSAQDAEGLPREFIFQKSKLATKYKASSSLAAANNYSFVASKDMRENTKISGIPGLADLPSQMAKDFHRIPFWAVKLPGGKLLSGSNKEVPNVGLSILPNVDPKNTLPRWHQFEGYLMDCLKGGTSSGEPGTQSIFARNVCGYISQTSLVVQSAHLQRKGFQPGGGAGFALTCDIRKDDVKLEYLGIFDLRHPLSLDGITPIYAVVVQQQTVPKSALEVSTPTEADFDGSTYSEVVHTFDSREAAQEFVQDHMRKFSSEGEEKERKAAAEESVAD